MKIIEIDSGITTTHGNLTREQLTALNRNENKGHLNNVRYAVQDKLCPFHSNRVKPYCSAIKCAMFSIEHETCLLAGGEPVNVAKGKQCPFTIAQKCGDECVMYQGGCRMVR